MPELLLLPVADERQSRVLDPVAILLGVAAASLLGLSALGLLRSSTVPVAGIGEGLIGVLAVDPTGPEPTGAGTEGAVPVFETFESRTVDPDERLVVERETGTSLLAASDDAWTLIDLDTGDRQRLKPQGVPVLVSANHLVVERDRSLWSIPLAELGHDGTGVKLLGRDVEHDEESGFLAASLSGLDEMVIASLGSAGLAQVARLDLATGETYWTEETPSRPYTPPYGGLHEAAGGGTFDVIDGSWAKLSDGAPVIAGPRFALVRVCVDPIECRYEWLDRRSGRRLDRPVAEILIEADRRQRVFFPIDLDSRVIATFGPGGFTIADLAKDRVLSFDDRFPDGLEAGETRVEPLLPFTARRGLVAMAMREGLVLLDLDDDVRYSIQKGYFDHGPRRYLLMPS